MPEVNDQQPNGYDLLDAISAQGVRPRPATGRGTGYDTLAGLSALGLQPRPEADAPAEADLPKGAK